jgi:hypothetical protein
MTIALRSLMAVTGLSRMTIALLAAAALLLPGTVTASSADASVLRTSGMEGGDFSSFDDISVTAGTLQVSTQRAANGKYSARATYNGTGSNGYARGQYKVDWRSGTDVWYSMSVFLPTGFTSSQRGAVDLIRWDNWSIAPDNADHGGLAVSSRGQLVLIKEQLKTQPYTVLLGPYTMPEGRWVLLEVRQRFASTNGQAVNEVWMDGNRLGSNTTANSYGRQITRLRAGIVSIDSGSQTQPLELWFDDASISTARSGTATMVPEPEPTPEAEPTPEPVRDPEPTVDPEPTPDPEPQPDPEATAEAAPSTDPEPTADNKPSRGRKDTKRKSFFLSTSLRGGDADLAFSYGRDDDQVLVGDWDGNGTDTLGVRRGATYYLSNTFEGGNADIAFVYGRTNDEVFVGDWDGDGEDTPAVRRGRTFHVTNRVHGAEAETVFDYGRPDDIILVGDWDGDGKDTLGVRRGATYYLNNRLRGGNADATFTYGRSGDLVYVGDWDGDGKDTLGVRRRSTYYLNNTLRGGNADVAFTYGRTDDVTLVGDWDGDGDHTLGVRRRSTSY